MKMMILKTINLFSQPYRSIQFHHNNQARGYSGVMHQLATSPLKTFKPFLNGFIWRTCFTPVEAIGQCSDDDTAHTEGEDETGSGQQLVFNALAVVVPIAVRSSFIVRCGIAPKRNGQIPTSFS